MIYTLTIFIYLPYSIPLLLALPLLYFPRLNLLAPHAFPFPTYLRRSWVVYTHWVSCCRLWQMRSGLATVVWRRTLGYSHMLCKRYVAGELLCLPAPYIGMEFWTIMKKSFLPFHQLHGKVLIIHYMRGLLSKMFCLISFIHTNNSHKIGHKKFIFCCCCLILWWFLIPHVLIKM